MSKDHFSPLRYPGGKSFLSGFLAEAIKLNGLEGGVYVEPFAGGCGAALSLLFNEFVGRLYLNDIDRGVYSFWKSVLDETDSLVRLVRESKLNVETWKKQRAIASKPAEHSRLQVGFATFYLNRTNRSGVSNGGPIGGHDQTGNYLINARFNPKELQRRIERVALFRERITISGKDAVMFLKHLVVKNALPEGSLVYLDPPYFEKGKRLYAHSFCDRQHRRLASYLHTGAAFRWILSYDDAALIHRIYGGEKNLLFMNYFMHTVRVGRELIIASTGCEVPREHFYHDASGASLCELAQA